MICESVQLLGPSDAQNPALPFLGLGPKNQVCAEDPGPPAAAAGGEPGAGARAGAGAGAGRKPGVGLGEGRGWWLCEGMLFAIGVLFGCFGRKIHGPGLPGGLIFYQGHLFPPKGHLCLLLVLSRE